MRINYKKESPFQRRSLQQHQLCKLLSSIPQRQHLPKLQSEFDDQGISHTPLTRLSHRNPPIRLKEDSAEEMVRRERIKMKIKCKVREGITEMASRELLRRKSSDLSQQKEHYSLLPTQAKSQFFIIRPPNKQEELQQILANCVIQPIPLHEKILPRRSAAIRNRIINSVLETRTLARSAFNHRSPYNKAKMSAPRLDNPEGIHEKLQPWRYADEGADDGPFRRHHPFH